MFDYDTNSGRVRMFGLFGQFEDNVSKTDVAKMLDAMDGRAITVHVQSEGGSVPEGLSIYNQLRNYSGSITMRLDSMVASIASVVAMAGDEVIAEENTTVMVHRAWTIAAGDAAEMRSVAEVLEKLDGDIAGIYARRTGGSVDDWLDYMRRETYFGSSPREGTPSFVDVGLVDRFEQPAQNRSDSLAASSGAGAVATLNVAVSPLVQAKLRTMRMRIRSLDRHAKGV